MSFIKWLLYPIAKNFIAGEKLLDAIKVTKQLNKQNIKTLINFLGEHITDRKDAEKIFKEYERVLNAIHSKKLNACISVKSTQFCLHPDLKYCYSTLVRLLNIAKKKRIFIWFDMESSKFTETTIELYLALLKHFSNIGIVIQSYLKRSEKDLKRILSRKGIVRLVKGAYKESSKIAYTKKKDIDKNFLKLMQILFQKSKRFSIGTHDNKLIEKAIQLNKKYKKNVELETLYGVRKKLITKLASEGYRVGIYLPYGTEWLAYGLRRIRERKRNILLLFRSLIGK